MTSVSLVTPTAVDCPPSWPTNTVPSRSGRLSPSICRGERRSTPPAQPIVSQPVLCSTPIDGSRAARVPRVREKWLQTKHAIRVECVLQLKADTEAAAALIRGENERREAERQREEAEHEAEKDQLAAKGLNPYKAGPQPVDARGSKKQATLMCLLDTRLYRSRLRILLVESFGRPIGDVLCTVVVGIHSPPWFDTSPSEATRNNFRALCP